MTGGIVPRLAVVAAAFSDDFREALKLAQAAGFGALQFEPRIGNLDLTTVSQSARRELRSILRAADLDIVGLRFDMGNKGLGPGADIDAALDRIEKVLATAAAMQCPLVSVELGPKPADEALVELGRRADRHGVTIAFRSDLAGFDSLDHAAKIGDCPWFGIDLDPVAMLKDEWTPTEIFSRLGRFIRHVRARDAILGSERRTKAAVLGTGSVDWQMLLANLDAAGYHGWITVDPVNMPNRAAASRMGISVLRSLPL
jgi:sugar phosphate isomerase/epimerase